jgi:hypothetical protein
MKFRPVKYDRKRIRRERINDKRSFLNSCR